MSGDFVHLHLHSQYSLLDGANKLPERRIPDHATYRRDGTSYQAGVMPDAPVRFDPRDEDSAKIRALVKGLKAMMVRQEAR